MLKYNLKDFFKEVVIHNDDWVSNGHFMFKKSILTATKGDGGFSTRYER